VSKINDMSRGEITIYQTKDRKVKLEIKLQHETIWLTQAQIAQLFRTDRSVITKHIHNLFKSKELDEKSNVQKMHIAFSDKPVKIYSLDVVISVGYRVNSRRATQFRIWATNIIRKHLIDGYTLNELRLKEKTDRLEALQKSIKLISSVKTHKELDYREAMGLLEVISDYSYGLELLDDYDNKKLKITKTSVEEKFRLTYEDAIRAVTELKKRFGASSLFGAEKDKSFKSSKENGAKRIADNALVALTLMIAESDPRERDSITKVVVNLINRNN